MLADSPCPVVAEKACFCSTSSRNNSYYYTNNSRKQGRQGHSLELFLGNLSLAVLQHLFLNCTSVTGVRIAFLCSTNDGTQSKQTNKTDYNVKARIQVDVVKDKAGSTRHGVQSNGRNKQTKGSCHNTLQQALSRNTSDNGKTKGTNQEVFWSSQLLGKL